jgi:hypothetical protein
MTPGFRRLGTAALAPFLALAVLLVAASPAAAGEPIDEAAAAFGSGQQVYVHPDAENLVTADAIDTVTRRTANASPKIYVAVIPRDPDYNTAEAALRALTTKTNSARRLLPADEQRALWHGAPEHPACGRGVGDREGSGCRGHARCCRPG